MTGRLGNMISTYVNFIALQWRLGHKYNAAMVGVDTEPSRYFLPLHMYGHPGYPDPRYRTKPYFVSIFRFHQNLVKTFLNATFLLRNVSFPTASCTWGGDRMKFNPR
jgi:hypothetical protein